MQLLEIFFVAVGLSMDALAVAACIGLGVRGIKKSFAESLERSLIVGLYFGIAQAVMPLIGYFAGIWFTDAIENISGYIAFAILAFIGGKMIKESFSKSDERINADLTFRKMLPLAIATSIDALAVGISFAFLNVNILAAVGLIGIVTLVLCAVGVKIGSALGTKFKSKAEFVGGAILILIGLHILWEQISMVL